MVRRTLSWRRSGRIVGLPPDDRLWRFRCPDGDARRHVSAELDWLADGVVIASRLGTAETAAIVHPRTFTSAMMDAAQSHGAKVRSGRVTGIVRRADGSTVEGVEVDGGVIEADAVVVAMGCFT
jgi:flavin-dependent dehydrogenase